MAARNGGLSAVNCAVHHRDLDLGGDAGLMLSPTYGQAREFYAFHETCDLRITEPFRAELAQTGFAIDKGHRHGKVKAEFGLQAVLRVYINQR